MVMHMMVSGCEVCCVHALVGQRRKCVCSLLARLCWTEISQSAMRSLYVTCDCKKNIVYAALLASCSHFAAFSCRRATKGQAGLTGVLRIRYLSR